MAIDNNGNDGIGTTNPNTKLHVQGNATIDYLQNVDQVTFTNSGITNIGSLTGVKLKLWSSTSATDSYWIGVASYNLTFHAGGNFRCRSQLNEIMNLSPS